MVVSCVRAFVITVDSCNKLFMLQIESLIISFVINSLIPYSIEIYIYRNLAQTRPWGLKLRK